MTDPAPTPTLNGQILGQAQRAAGAVLQRTLDAHDLAFDHWVVLLSLSDAGGSPPADTFVDQVAAILRTDRSYVERSIDELVRDDRLVRVGDRIERTATGTTLFETAQAAVAGISARLYGDLPTEDRETTARVLLTLTERANAELASRSLLQRDQVLDDLDELLAAA